jgi:anti-sigma factor RsiW
MIATDRLVALALGELSGDAELEVETHVLSCGSCARRYASLLRMGPAIAELVRDGSAMMPVTCALAERLDAEGLISRRYELEPGKPVPCTVGPDDVYSLTTYHVDLAGVSRVDLIRFGQRLSDIPFDAGAGRVYVLTAASVLRKLPTQRVPLQLVAVEAGGERVLGDYVLDHTAPS